MGTMSAMDGRLQTLFDTDAIRADPGAIFGCCPASLPGDLDPRRVDGMMLGLAIGDSLGGGSEGLNPAQRAARHGEIRDYLPNRHLSGRRVGVPSDDTQLAFWTLEQAVDEGGLDPDDLLRRVLARRIYGIGGTVRAALAHAATRTPWERTGRPSAGNGALMRIAPVLIPHLRRPSPALWADAAIATMITHNDRAAVSSSVAWVALLWDLLTMDRAPEPAWWVERYVEVARDVEGESSYESRSPSFADWSGPLWRFVRDEVPAAYEAGRSAREACDRWYSGAYLLETVPSALLILMRYAGDPEESIVQAVNDTRDNDTVAAIVGSAIGALHGADALPRHWREGLLGRTGADDDGRVFELLAAARGRFYPDARLG